MHDLKQRATRGALAKLCGQGLILVVKLGYLVVMARLLEPSDFGLVAMVTVVTGAYDLFINNSLSLATIQRANVTRDQISTLFWISLAVGIAFGLVCILIAPLLVSFYNEPGLFWVTVALAAGFVLNAAGVQHSAILQREMRYIELTAIEAGASILSVSVGIVMAINGFGYWSLVAAALVTPATNSALMWFVTTWIPGPPWRIADVKSMVKFGATVTLNNFVVYAGYNLEKVLLGRYWGAEVLGLYGRANQLINLPTWQLHSALGGVAFSAMSRVQNDADRLKNYFLKIFSASVSITAPATLFLAAFSDDIIWVALGPQWSEAASVFRLLAPTVLIFGIINPSAWLLFSIGLQKRSLAIALVISPLCITSYFIGIPYGPNGVALAYSAAMTLWLVPHILWALSGTPISPRDLIAAGWRPIVAALFATISAYGAASLFDQWPSPHYVRFLIGCFVMLTTYAGVLLFIMKQKDFYFSLISGLRTQSG